MTPTREQLLERAIQRVMDYDANTDILHGTGLLDELAAALAPQEAAPCIGRDPLCPCQDGDSCHYRDGTATDTKAWPIPAAPMPPIEVGDWVEDSIRIRAVLTDRDVEWWNSSEAAGTRLGVTEIRKKNGTVWRRP